MTDFNEGGYDSNLVLESMPQRGCTVYEWFAASYEAFHKTHAVELDLSFFCGCVKELVETGFIWKATWTVEGTGTKCTAYKRSLHTLPSQEDPDASQEA